MNMFDILNYENYKPYFNEVEQYRARNRKKSEDKKFDEKRKISSDKTSEYGCTDIGYK